MKTLELSKCSTFREGVPRWNDVVLGDQLTVIWGDWRSGKSDLLREIARATSKDTPANERVAGNPIVIRPIAQEQIDYQSLYHVFRNSILLEEHLPVFEEMFRIVLEAFSLETMSLASEDVGHLVRSDGGQHFRVVELMSGREETLEYITFLQAQQEFIVGRSTTRGDLHHALIDSCVVIALGWMKKLIAQGFSPADGLKNIPLQILIDDLDLYLRPDNNGGDKAVRIYRRLSRALPKARFVVTVGSHRSLMRFGVETQVIHLFIQPDGTRTAHSSRRWVDTYREMYKADVHNSSWVTPLEWLKAAYTETGESLQLTPRQVMEKIEKAKG